MDIAVLGIQNELKKIVRSRVNKNDFDDIFQECNLRILKMDATEQQKFLSDGENLAHNLGKIANNAIKKLKYSQQTEKTGVPDFSIGENRFAFCALNKMRGVNRKNADRPYNSKGAWNVMVPKDHNNNLVNQYFSFFDCERFIVRKAQDAGRVSLLTRRE